jgi:putative tricarboxylic transport membrane protein
MERRLALGDLVVGLGIVALGLVVLWQTTTIPENVFAQLGPRPFPYAVGGALVVLGGLLAAEAVRGGWSGAIEEPDVPLHYGSLLWLLAGLVANVAVIGWLGFVPAATLQFVLVARAYGSTRVLRDVGIAIVLTIVAMIGFARGFGVNIGGGPVDAEILRQFDMALAALGFGG